MNGIFHPWARWDWGRWPEEIMPAIVVVVNAVIAGVAPGKKQVRCRAGRAPWPQTKAMAPSLGTA